MQIKGNYDIQMSCISLNRTMIGLKVKIEKKRDKLFLKFVGVNIVSKACFEVGFFEVNIPSWRRTSNVLVLAIILCIHCGIPIRKYNVYLTYLRRASDSRMFNLTIYLSMLYFSFALSHT